MVSKTKLDRAGRILASRLDSDEYERLELEDLLDEYRKAHLTPLSEMTLELQEWLAQYGSRYYIAQRLKRKPQILRKLRRFSVRLTQLQDIGGCRIILSTNPDIDKLLLFLKECVDKQSDMSIERVTDYRVRGRDDSGYRALHLILSRSGYKLELQVRSRIQHYWAESIERTSVIYGFYLKELEGNPIVVQYFKSLSDLFYDIEANRLPSTALKLEIANARDAAEEIIKGADTRKVFDSYVNEGIIRTLVEKEKHLGGRGLKNWIIVFDWNQGSFVSWDVVARDPDEAIRKYVEQERAFPPESGFEVVLVGSSEVATIRETHSHYFGINSQDAILESVDQSIVGFSSHMDIDVGGRQILAYLHRKHMWGRKAISQQVLKNHYCKGLLTFDQSLETLIDKGIVQRASAVTGISLNPARKSEIEDYL